MSLRLHVELVYDPGCPNVDAARDVLTAELQRAAVPAVWTEWRTDDGECPERLRNYGSPTVLVNGQDVAPGPHPWTSREDGDGPRCRIYRDGDIHSGAPPATSVAQAIQRAIGPSVG